MNLPELERCAGVADDLNESLGIPTLGLLPPCIACDRREDPGKSHQVHWLNPPARWDWQRLEWVCDQRLPAAAPGPERG